MLLSRSLTFQFAKIKPLKTKGVTLQKGIHFISQTGSNDIIIQNPLEVLISSLAACELSTLKVITAKSNFKIHKVTFTRIQSALDLEKFMKGGPQDVIEPIFIEAEVESTGTQKDLDEHFAKAINCCPVYQILKHAGVKVESKWTNVKTLS